MKFHALVVQFLHLIAVTYTYGQRSLEDSDQSLINAEFKSSNDLDISTSVNDDQLLSKNFSSPLNISDTSKPLPLLLDLLKDDETKDVERNGTLPEFTSAPSSTISNNSVNVKLQTDEIGSLELTTDTSVQNQTVLKYVTTKSHLNVTSIPLPTVNIVLAPDDENITITNAVLRQTLIWLNDSYTVALLIPISAGLVIASTIIVTVAACRCMRRRCYRKRLRRKILPEDVKNMRPSDRAKLLAETSDDEF